MNVDWFAQLHGTGARHIGGMESLESVKSIETAQCSFEQRFRPEEFDQLPGKLLPRQRPETRAGATRENDGLHANGRGAGCRDSAARLVRHVHGDS
jgi:hypothetical protein